MSSISRCPTRSSPRAHPDEPRRRPRSSLRPRSPRHRRAGGRCVLAAGPELARGLESADAPAVGLTFAATHLRGRLRLGVVGRWSHGLERGTDTPQQASFDAWLGGPTVGVGPWTLGGRRRAVHRARAARHGARRERRSAHLGRRTLRSLVGTAPHGFGWFAGVGLDVYARRQAFAIAGATTYATPVVAPRLAVGVTFGLPR